MSSRVLITATIAALLPCGCSVPRPYQKDPLIQNAKRQKGNFEKASTKQDRPIEPTSPAAPPGEWVKVQPAVDKPMLDKFVQE